MSPQRNDRRPTTDGVSAPGARPALTDGQAYGSLRDAAERILEKGSVSLSREGMTDILQLVQDIDSAHHDLKQQDRQMAELRQELRGSRKRFHELYQEAPMAFVTLTKDGFIEMCNHTARRLLSDRAPEGHGAAPALVGRRFSSFVAHKDLQAYYKGLRNLAVQNKSSFFDLRLSGQGGRPINVHIQASPRFDEKGRFTYWHLALSDITALRRKEAQLAQVHEQLSLATRAASLGLWTYDLKNHTTRWNEQLYLMLGLEPRPGPEKAEYFFEFIHPEDRTGIVAGLQSVLAMEGDRLDEDFRIVRADGRIRWLASRGQLFRDDDGEVQRIAGINFDITERKEAETALHLAHLQLTEQLNRTEQVNAELSQYAYAVSHDLKAPLRAIRNYVDFLHEDLAGTLHGEQLKYLKGLKTAVDEGEALISDLLGFSRIGRMMLQPETVDVPGVVNEIRSRLDLAPDVEIAVQTQWPELCTDRTLLWQILVNLISNAAKFNRRNPRRVEIGCRKAPDDCIELFVRDNGIGIEPEFKDQIFRVFQRLHAAKEYEGTGIGLAIVQKAARRLGGDVRLASEPGKGSTFYVRLPRELAGDDGNRDEGYEI